MQFAPRLADLSVHFDGRLLEMAPMKTCTRLVLPVGILSIGGRVFAEWTWLIAVILPEGLISVGEECFRGCGRLTSVVFPRTLARIDSSAFHSCHKLRSAKLPVGLQTIGSSAFHACFALVDVHISPTVEEIGESAFEHCISFKDLSLPEGIVAVRAYAFHGCTGLTAVVLPTTVVRIENNAFEGCRLLEAIPFPPGLKFIGHAAFRGCVALTSIAFPPGIFQLEVTAFDYCSGLLHVTVSQNTVFETYYNVQNPFTGCAAVEVLLISPCNGLAVPNTVWDNRLWHDQYRDTFPNLRRVWVPNISFRDLVNGVRVPVSHTCLATIPQSVRAFPRQGTWAGVQLKQFWAPPRTGHRPSTARRAVEHIVCLIGERLSRSMPFSIPPEMWFVILGFLRHDVAFWGWLT